MLSVLSSSVRGKLRGNVRLCVGTCSCIVYLFVSQSLDYSYAVEHLLPPHPPPRHSPSH